MLTVTEIAGFVGAGLAGAAYVPQIWHLVRVRCSAGVSRVAFGVWLAASLLVSTHALAMGAAVFVVLGAVQSVAIAVILVFATRYRSSRCAGHLPLEAVSRSMSDPLARMGSRSGTRARMLVFGAHPCSPGAVQTRGGGIEARVRDHGDRRQRGR